MGNELENTNEVIEYKLITLRRLDQFLTLCKELFGEKLQVDENTENINTYILNIDYESELGFDVTEIV